MASKQPSKPQPGGTSVGGGASRQRILRIGVLLGGKIVEERLIRERVPVTIGQSVKNTFSIPLEGLPLEFTLFALDEGKYSLRFLSKMDGRISDGGAQVATLDALKQRGATNTGDYYQMPLSDAARGKLSLGELTILFQFVTEPPRQPKPMLPASVRGTIADRIDPRLSVILSISIVCHFAIVIWALFTDIERGGSVAERAYERTFKQDQYEVKLQEPVKPTPTADAGSAAGSAAPTDEPKPQQPKPANDPAPRGNPNPNPDPNPGRSSADTVKTAEDEARKFANLLTGEGAAGKSEGDMASRRPGADLGQEIDAARETGQNAGIGGGTGSRGTRDGGTKVGTGSGPKIDGPGGTTSAGGGKGEEKVPSGRISVSDKQAFDESTLTPDIILAKIKSAYMSAITRCYKNYLAKDATARGKVTLELTINETGRTVQHSASGMNNEVDGCINGLMSAWRFPIPKDKDGDPTEASFRIALQLVPD